MKKDYPKEKMTRLTSINHFSSLDYNSIFSLGCSVFLHSLLWHKRQSFWCSDFHNPKQKLWNFCEHDEHSM